MAFQNADKIQKLLYVTPNPDGTITRPPGFFPYVPPSTTDPTSPSLSKDVSLDSEKDTWVRIFLPRETLLNTSSKQKLPILVYVHGGGFIFGSPAVPSFHDFCSDAAAQLGALVVSAKYRLTPEYRLPAAYDDVLEALTWVGNGKDEWIREYGDTSSCVLMGESAGGNIAYHVGLRAAASFNDYKPLVIKGFVLIQPYFSGLDRTESETRLFDDPVVSVERNDLLWELSLPVGVDRSHEYCDPTTKGGSSLINRVRDSGWWVGVAACDGDPLFDKDVELAKLLVSKGVSVRTLFGKGGKHGMFVAEPESRKEFLQFVMSSWPRA